MSVYTSTRVLATGVVHVLDANTERALLVLLANAACIRVKLLIQRVLRKYCIRIPCTVQILEGEGLVALPSRLLLCSSATGRRLVLIGCR